jgi:hypothetical protein
MDGERKTVQMRSYCCQATDTSYYPRPASHRDMFPYHLQAAQQLTQYSHSHGRILSHLSKLRIADERTCDRRIERGVFCYNGVGAFVPNF